MEHRPAVCRRCQTPLTEAPVVGRERRQVHDLPPVRLVVTEHQAVPVRCPACQAVTAGAFAAQAPSRAQYGPRMRAVAVYLVEEHLVPLGRVQQLLADLFGAHLGRGTLVSWVQPAARGLEPVEQQLKAALERAPVLHCDETGVRRAGQLAWAHVTSTARLTPYAIQAHRGQQATEAIGILPGYTGVSVQDRGQRAGRLGGLSRLPPVPPCVVPYPPSARAHLPGRGVPAGLGHRAQSPAA